MMYIRVFLISVLFSSMLFGVSINTSKNSYVQGGQITVNVSDLPRVSDCEEVPNEPRKSGSNKKSQCSWIGLFSAYDDSKASNLLAYQYTGDGREGTFTFDGLSYIDEYEVRVFYNNNYKEKAFHPFEVVKNDVIGEKVQLKTTKESFNVDEVISVDVSGLPGNSDDWIGIFYAFDESEEKHLISKIETKGAKSGTFSISALDYADKYEVRVFFNGSFHEEDYYPFEVVEGGGDVNNVIINEVMAFNAHTILDSDFSDFSDWIELYNGGNKSVDLGGFKLSDKLDEASWTIPNGTFIGPNEYMLFWADKENMSGLNHHTDFSLKGKGEAVALFDKNGLLVDSIEFGTQKADISCKKENGNIVYMHPTPGAKNSASLPVLALSSVVTYSMNGGFYNGAQSLTLSASNGAKIYYTVDESYPTLGSKVYNGAIMIDKTMVVRAMSVEAGKFPSVHKTHTFLINESSTLPVVSLTTDEKYLWDPMIGIYDKGINGIASVCEEGVANYNQDWKRPANIEFFDKNGNLGFNQEISLEISGNCSRINAQKALGIKANDKYGEESINYKIFDGKPIDTFHGFKLRSSGQDWWKTIFRDAMIQQLVKDDLDVDYQEYEPALVFLNGEYWGIYNMREYRNEKFIASNHNLSPKKIDVLYGSGEETEVKNGSADNYNALLAYIQNNDLSDNSRYNYVADRMQIGNYIDYMISQIYSSNYDWPGNNIRYWREQKDGAKWRWMMDDQDVAFNLFDEDDNKGLYYNMLVHATNPNSADWRNPPASTVLMRNLLKNEGFKNAFVARYDTLLTSTFAPATVKALINKMKDGINREMPRHIATWGDAGPDYVDMDAWNTYIDVMLNFADERPAIVREHLNQMFP